MQRSNGIRQGGCDLSASVALRPDDAPADLTRMAKSNSGEFSSRESRNHRGARDSCSPWTTRDASLVRTLPRASKPNEPAAALERPVRAQIGALS
jgi:hypothetical protein